MKKKITVKQRRFVDEYVISGNATEAAKKAGYSPRSAKQMGAENLSKPVIKTEINKRLKEIENHKIMDMKEVMERLSAIARGEVTDEKIDNLGNVHRVKADTSTFIKAMELIGKRYSAWVDRKEVSGDLSIDIGVGDYDDDD